MYRLPNLKLSRKLLSYHQDMQDLAEKCKRLNYRPEQVQDFTPTPMTLATTMFYTGLNPYTMEKVYVARTKQDKDKQKSYFFFWKKNRHP